MYLLRTYYWAALFNDGRVSSYLLIRSLYCPIARLVGDVDGKKKQISLILCNIVLEKGKLRHCNDQVFYTWVVSLQHILHLQLQLED